MVQRILREHQVYLDDHVRLAAYAAAVADVVRPGDVVLDLGAGSGILGLMACRAGAGRVYALDRTGIVHVAAAVAAENGWAERIVPIRGASTDVSLPERAGVALCDQLGPFGFDGGVVRYYADATARLLVPSPRLVPRHLRTWLAPAEAPRLQADLDAWLNPHAGFRFRAMREYAESTVYALPPEQIRLLAAGIPCLDHPLGTPLHATDGITGEWVIEHGGRLHGICGWFVADLSENQALTNDPVITERIRRSVGFLPTGEAVQVEPGDCVRAQVDVAGSMQVVRWRVDVFRGSVPLASFARDTFRSLLLAGRAPGDARVPGQGSDR